MTAPARKVVKRNSVQFGLPCLQGTRVPSISIWRGFHQGMGVAEIVKFYKHPLIDVTAVEVALRYEMRRRRK